MLGVDCPLRAERYLDAADTEQWGLHEHERRLDRGDEWRAV